MGHFDSLYCPEERVFVQKDCLEGGFLLSSSNVPGVCPGGGGGVVMDEIATCIKWKSKFTFSSRYH